METFINQKEEYNIYNKLQKSRLILHNRNPIELSRNNGESWASEKSKKVLFNENLLLKNNTNKILSLKNSFHQKEISNNISVELPFDIKLLYKCKKYLNSIEGEKIKQNKQLYKMRTISEINSNNNNSVNNNNSNNGTDYKIYQKYSNLNEKTIKNNNKLVPINFRKHKDLLNIKTFKYNADKKIISRNLALKKLGIHEYKSLQDKNFINFSGYSNKNKTKKILEIKNNNTNLSTTLKGSLSTTNMNNKNTQLNLSNISKFIPTNDIPKKIKEDNNSLTNYSSIEKKHNILLHPIKNIKTLSLNNINKTTNTNEILISKLPSTKKNNNIPEKENVKEIENLNEQNKVISPPKLNLNNNNILNNYQRQIPQKVINDNQNDSVTTNNNNLLIPLRRSASNIYNGRIYKKIFNADTNTIKNIFSFEEENKDDNDNNNNNNESDKQIQNYDLRIKNDNENDNKNESDNNNNEFNNISRHFSKRKKTKILDFFPNNKKINNKFLAKIKEMNEKSFGKDALITHQIKINKKIAIVNENQKISQMIRKKEEPKKEDREFEKDIKMIKSEYIEIYKNSQENLDKLINLFRLNGGGVTKNFGLGIILAKNILLVNEFSTIFIPLVDITQKRKSFIITGKLCIINKEFQVFEDKKSKFIQDKTLLNDDYYKYSVYYISKELNRSSSFSSQIIDNENIKKENNLNKYESPSKSNFSSHRRKFSTKSIIRARQTQKISKRKKLTFIDKLTPDKNINKYGFKSVSILGKEEFFDVQKYEKDNETNLIKVLQKGRNIGFDPRVLKHHSHKAMNYIHIFDNIGKRENYFENLKMLIQRGEVSLFMEYYNVISKKIFLSGQDSQGNTLLILAVKQGLNTISKLLMKDGIDINIQNNSGNTALHYALSGKNYVMADELRKQGAIESLKNNLGYSPWDCIGKNIDE